MTDSPWIDIARRDYRNRALYGTGLPPCPDDMLRAMYRVGWIVAEHETGEATYNLPAYFAGTERGGYLWLIATHPRPVYQFTRGATPSGCGGYHSLDALLKLKGDSIRNR